MGKFKLTFIRKNPNSDRATGMRQKKHCGGLLRKLFSVDK